MKTILFATDFSAGSENALPYALSLCEMYNASLTIYHSCFVPVYASEVPYEAIPTEQYLFTAREKLDQLKKDLSEKYKNIKIETILETGVAADNILNYLSSFHIEMMVMGTKGVTGWKKIFMGSTANKVLQNSTCKVIVVPENTVFKKFRKIIYATDYRETDFTYLNDVTKIANTYGAEIVIVHISDLERTDSFEQNMFKWFKEDVIKNVAYPKISFELLFDKEIGGALNAAIKSNQADLLVMATRKRTTLMNVFDKSLTNEMVHHINIPLLSFHIDRS